MGNGLRQSQEGKGNQAEMVLPGPGQRGAPEAQGRAEWWVPTERTSEGRQEENEGSFHLGGLRPAWPQVFGHRSPASPAPGCPGPEGRTTSHQTDRLCAGGDSEWQPTSPHKS